ncbi:MAG: MauE/DoxX family redox-associated membrane protein [Pseudonocardiaceae bacterium]
MRSAPVNPTAESRLSAPALDVVGTLVRLGLAALWLASGGIKAADLPQTYLAVQAYQVLPAGVVSSVAMVLPFVEIGLGLVLLAGVGTRLVAALSGLLLLVFVAGVSQAWARGLAIDCGCFGGGGAVAADQTAYGWELARDTGFLMLTGWLLIRPRSYLSMDRTLAGREPAVVGAIERMEG